RTSIEEQAAGLDNVVFVDYQPKERRPEVLAAADVHVVPLRRGLARASVPSKTYSILAAGRTIVASVDEGTEVARLVEKAGAGLAVPPEDPVAFTDAIVTLLEGPDREAAMARGGRAFVESSATRAASAPRYEELFEERRSRRRGAAGEPRGGHGQGLVIQEGRALGPGGRLLRRAPPADPPVPGRHRADR